MSRYFYILILLLIQTEAFARGIRVDSCTIPFDFTIGSVCVLSTLMWWILAGVIISFVASIFRSK
jgi:hypothetical protein